MKKLLKVKLAEKLTVTLKSPMQRCRRNLQNLMRQAPFEIDLRFYRASHGIALLFLDLLSRLLSATPVLTLFFVREDVVMSEQIPADEIDFGS